MSTGSGSQVGLPLAVGQLNISSTKWFQDTIRIALTGWRELNLPVQVLVAWLRVVKMFTYLPKYASGRF